MLRANKRHLVLGRGRTARPKGGWRTRALLRVRRYFDPTLPRARVKARASKFCRCHAQNAGRASIRPQAYAKIFSGARTRKTPGSKSE